jgi:UPF0271 protein
MRAAAAECTERGVAIGAHVSYRDRDGFGRRPLDVAAERLADDIVEQWDALVAEAAVVGGTVSFVKPHGALYDRMATDPDVAAVVVGALVGRCAVLVAPPVGEVPGPALAAGIRVVPEGFCDRGYDVGGVLLPRDHTGSLVDDPDAVAERARSLAVDGGMATADGSWVGLEVETLCLHGDRPGADVRARAVRAALERAGVAVRSFIGAPAG